MSCEHKFVKWWFKKVDIFQRRKVLKIRCSNYDNCSSHDVICCNVCYNKLTQTKDNLMLIKDIY